MSKVSQQQTEVAANKFKHSPLGLIVLLKFQFSRNLVAYTQFATFPRALETHVQTKRNNVYVEKVVGQHCINDTTLTVFD